VLAALIAALALVGGLSGVLFWQLKRAARASDRLLEEVRALSELKILLAAAEVSVADKERAMNLLIAERDNLQSAYDTVKDQRDELLQDALDHATPSTVATSVRDALERLRDFPPKLSEAEGVPDVPGAPDDNGS
jgi:hypothetical protein